jgi:hypothetical protein
MTDAEREQWNAALERGDPDEIEDLRERFSTAIFTKIMNDDPNYAKAGYKYMMNAVEGDDFVIYDD